MADEVKVYADGTPILEYPKWVRDNGKEMLVNSKEEEDKLLGPKDKQPKGWSK